MNVHCGIRPLMAFIIGNSKVMRMHRGIAERKVDPIK